MALDPLQIPMLDGRIAIASAALLHSLFATFIVGATLIGATIATAAYWTRRASYQRLAHMIAFALVLTTGTISFLGVTFVFLLNIFWPRFWHTLFHIMFWPFLIEAFLFLGEAVFAYAWYYLWSWASRSGWRQRVHLAFAWIAAGCAVTAMFTIDITASYMLTPAPADAAWQNILNPTMIDLDLHRWFGNVTWAGFALAALCAIGLLRARTESDRDHYHWAGRMCFSIGFSALLVMPVIGYQYMLHLRYGQPQAFETLMLGERSWLFDLVALLYGLLIVLGSFYIYRVVRSSQTPPASLDVFMPISLLILIAAALVFAQPYYLQHVPFVSVLTDRQINPLGKMQPNKYFAIAFLVFFAFANAVYFFRFLAVGASFGQTDRCTPSLLIALALCSALMILTMGWSRETARAANGYLIYGHLSLEDERPTYGAPEGQIGGDKL
jgi:cytochrome d ubiquinol oxidase subunit I